VHQDACILQNIKQEFSQQREHPLAVAALGVAAGVAPGVAAGEAPVTAGDAAGFAGVPTAAPGLAGDTGEPASGELISHLLQPL
jgi:hypothetical protein